MDSADLDRRFNYHAPATQERAAAHALVRASCQGLAEIINDACPDGREKSTALTKIEEAMFWGNAALARQT
ncbi:hypothetical protein [Streptomyces sp. NPDC059631]|uniref:Acb2/Tad1 domain-containing protein n=1 Tax=unclassified Streptomyces TaxID=2593676 RepID=UPI0036791DC8